MPLTTDKMHEPDKIMITDCHTHINCPTSGIDTKEHLDACSKVDSAFVHATFRDYSLESNRELGEYVAKHHKLVGFAIINPLRDAVNPEAVQAMTTEQGLKGIVLYCSSGKFHPADSRAMQLYESATKLKLPIFFHNVATYRSDSILNYAQPYLLDEVAREFPALKFVIGSMGLPFLSQTLSMLAKHENVYADLTIAPQKKWEVYNMVVSASEAGVMDKLLFGSGYPIAKAGICIETLLGFNMLLANTNLPGVAREDIRSVVERDTLSLLGID